MAQSPRRRPDLHGRDLPRRPCGAARRRRIAGVVPAAALPSGVPAEDLGGGLLAPGFIDAQVNGGGGVLFNASPTADGAAAVAAAHRRFGTTGCLPTFITDRPERQAEAVAAVRDAIAERRPGVLGLHLEGPHLSVARKGAHDPALIRPMTEADLAALLSTGLDTLLVTVAAETVTPAQIRRLTAAASSSASATATPPTRP